MRASHIPGFELVLLFLAVATLPIYFWDSGLPQVTHFLFLLLAVINFVVQIRPLPNDTGIQLLLLLSMVVLVRQSVMTMAGTEIVLVPALHMLFSFVVFITVFSYSVQDTDRVWRVVFWGTMAALCLQFVMIAKQPVRHRA